MCKKSPSSILTKVHVFYTSCKKSFYSVVKWYFCEKMRVNKKGSALCFLLPRAILSLCEDSYDPWCILSPGPLAASRHETSSNLLTSLTRRGGDFSSQFSSGAVFPVMAYTSLPESRHLSPRAANIIISRRKKKEETLFKLSTSTLTLLNSYYQCPLKLFLSLV